MEVPSPHTAATASGEPSLLETVHGSVSQFFQPWVPVAHEVADRVAAPFQEIFQDAAESSVVQTVSEYMSGGWRRAKAPLEEIATDAGLPERCVPLALVATPACTLLGPTGLAVAATATSGGVAGPAIAVTLCGLTATVKSIYCGVSVGFVMGAYSFWTRFPTDTDGVIQRRSAWVMLLVGGLKFYLGYHGGVPKEIVDQAEEYAKLVPYPLTLNHLDLAIWYLQEALTVPLIVLNIGHLGGMKPDRVAVPAGSIFAGHMLMAATLLLDDWNRSFVVWLMGTTCFTIAGRELAVDLPRFAQQVSEGNAIRLRLASDLLLIPMSGASMITGGVLFELVDDSKLLLTTIVMDLAMKFGVSHILLKYHDPVVQAGRFLETEAAAGR